MEIPFGNTIEAHFELGNNVMNFLINKPIIDVVIETIFFDPNGAGIKGVQKALCSFKPTETDHEDASENELVHRDHYIVHIKTSRSFTLCINFIPSRSSFRMASMNMQHTKNESGISFYDGCSDTIAATYVRTVCSYCLQTLSDALMSTWAFSIALDWSKYQSRSYIDIQSLFCIKGKL